MQVSEAAEKMRNSGFLSLVERMSGAFVVKCFGAGASFLLSVFMGRVFLASGLGTYSLSYSIFTLALIVAKFGLDLSLIKYVSIEYANGAYGRLKACLRKAILFSCSVATVIAVILVASSGQLGDLFEYDGLAQMLPYMAVALIPYAAAQLTAACLRSTPHLLSGLFFESAALPISFLAVLSFSVLGMGERDIDSVGPLFLCAVIVVGLCVALVWCLCRCKLVGKAQKGYDFRPVLQTASPLLLVSSTNYFLGSTDVLMLGLWYASDVVGIYTVATKITLLFSMLLTAINAVVGPRIAVMYKSGDMDGLKELVQKATRLMVLLAIVVFAVLQLVGMPLLNLWGEEFEAGINVYRIALLGQAFALATGPLATVLMMCDLEKVHRNNTLVCAALNVVFNCFLIQSFGMVGAAISTAVCLIIKNAYCVFAVRKKLGFWCL